MMMQSELTARLAAMSAPDLRLLVARIWHELYPEGGADDTGPSGADAINAIEVHLGAHGLLPDALDPAGFSA